MRIDIYLAQMEISLDAFSRAIGVTPEAVRRYRAGDRLPHWDVMLRISEATKGAVTPNDFLPVARDRASHRAKARAERLLAPAAE